MTKGIIAILIRAFSNQKAKDILIKLGDWFIELIRPLSDEQIQNILKTEHGGINESFADLYSITKNKKYLETAEKLSQKAILDPLIKKEDKLTGLHANTQIPKVIGFEKIGIKKGSRFSLLAYPKALYCQAELVSASMNNHS